MCNPATQRPISEAMPLVNALIEEAERNCIDIYKIDVWAHPGGQFRIDINAYDGGERELADILGLTPDVTFVSHGRVFQSATRSVGRWTISSYFPLGDDDDIYVEVAAA